MPKVRLLKWWLRLPLRSFRFWLAFTGTAIVLASLLVILAVSLENWRLGLPAGTDKITRINTVVAVSAYGAVIVAAIFALIAYWQASGRPYLEPEIIFPGGKANELHFETIPTWYSDSVDFTLPPFPVDINRHNSVLLKPIDPAALGDSRGILLGSVQVRNVRRYSARNPGVRIEFDGLIFDPIHSVPGSGPPTSPGWTPIERWTASGKNGFRAIQWDGGTENIIHGNWTRALPDLDFSFVVTTRLEPAPALLVTVVADGCSPRTIRMVLQLPLIDMRNSHAS
jgi:hypothetical protein